MGQISVLVYDGANDSGVFEVRDDHDSTLIGIIDIGRERAGGPHPGRGWYVRDDEEGMRFTGWFEVGLARADLATAARLWDSAPSLGRLLDEDEP